MRGRPAPRVGSRRGSAYVAVLGTGLVVSIVAASALAIVGIRLRLVEHINDARRATSAAQSAVEQAVSIMNADANWRTNYTSGVETQTTTIDGVQMSFKLVDEDGNLADDATDSVCIYGYGRVGQTVQVAKARARIDGGLPLEVLRTVVFAKTSFEVKNGKKLTVVGGPAATDGNLNLNTGDIIGNAESASVSGSGTISGTSTLPANRKGVPARTLFDEYKNRATTLTFNGDLKELLLAASVNQYSGTATNPDGLYYINTGGADIKMEEFRLKGTLVIDVGTGKLKIKEVIAKSHREDFPVLIVKGDVEIDQNTDAFTEKSNLNPVGVPYQGDEDNDTGDEYPNKISGLVHVIGDVKAKKITTTFFGVLVVTEPY